jgi:hypothetical protein
LFVLGYAGFFRASELCDIRRSDIKHVEIKIMRSKAIEEVTLSEHIALVLVNA